MAIDAPGHFTVVQACYKLQTSISTGQIMILENSCFMV